MSLYPASFEKLTDCLRRLPGIGAKSAQRMAFYLLSLSDAEAEDFAAAIVDAKHSLHRCSICQNLTDEEVCGICASAKRDKSKICVVSDPRDVIANGPHLPGFAHGFPFPVVLLMEQSRRVCGAAQNKADRRRDHGDHAAAQPSPGPGGRGCLHMDLFHGQLLNFPRIERSADPLVDDYFIAVVKQLRNPLIQ